MYFKYIPYIFLLMSAAFLFDAVSKYNEGKDPFPSILFVLAGIIMFFVRKRSYSRFNEPKK